MVDLVYPEGAPLRLVESKEKLTGLGVIDRIQSHEVELEHDVPEVQRTGAKEQLSLDLVVGKKDATESSWTGEAAFDQVGHVVSTALL